jgi:hypothetical protein
VLVRNLVSFHSTSKKEKRKCGKILIIVMVYSLFIVFLQVFCMVSTLSGEKLDKVGGKVELEYSFAQKNGYFEN